MVRTVRVRLELDRADYRQGLRDAATDTRTFDAEVKAAGKDISAMGVEAKTTGVQVESMGREVDTAAKKTTTLGDETAKTRTKVIDLAKDIEQTRASLAAMREEFGKTGQVDVSGYAEASKQLRDLERILAGLTETALSEASSAAQSDGQQGFFSSLLDGVKSAGQQAAGLFEGGLQDGLTKPQVIAALAPVVGAVLNGAVLAGVGTVGLAAGIAAQFRDPVIQQAGSDMVGGIMDDLQSASRGLDDEILAGIDRLGGAFDAVTPNLRHGFDALRPALSSLSAGVSGLIEKAGPGVEHALEAAAPILEELGNDLPGLGQAFTLFFDEVSAGAESGAHSVQDMIHLFEVLLVVMGAVTDILAADYDLFTGIESLNLGKIKSSFESLKNLKDVGHDAKAAADGTNQFGSALGGVASSAPAAAGAVSEFADTLKLFDDSALDAQRSTMQFADSESHLVDTIKKGKKHWEKNADTVRQYRELYLDAEQAAERHAEALLKSGASAQEAAAAYQQDMANLDGMLRKAGLTAQQISILSQGLDNVAKVRRGSVDIEINVRGNTALIGNQGQFLISGKGIKLEQYGGIEYAAEGMVTNRPTVVFGEAGVDEAFIPSAGISEARAASLIGTAMSWHPQATAALVGSLGRLPGAAPMVNVAAPSLDAGVLARAVASALQGAQVVLDGQAVGHIQGRQALLYTRGG